MKVVVIGGTGLIGSKVVAKLTELGHKAIPASPQLGVDTVTGEGLDDPRKVVTDPAARYFGAVIDDHSIVPGDGATIFETHFTDWLASSVSSDAR